MIFFKCHSWQFESLIGCVKNSTTNHFLFVEHYNTLIFNIINAFVNKQVVFLILLQQDRYQFKHLFARL